MIQFIAGLLVFVGLMWLADATLGVDPSLGEMIVLIGAWVMANIVEESLS